MCVCVYMLSWKLGVDMLSWNVLISGFSSWLPATCQPAQAMGLSSTGQVISDSTSPLLDVEAQDLRTD